MDYTKKIECLNIDRFLLLDSAIALIQAYSPFCKLRIFNAEFKEIFTKQDVYEALQSGPNEILVRIEDLEYSFYSISQKGKVQCNSTINLQSPLILSNTLVTYQTNLKKSFVSCENSKLQLYNEKLIKQKTKKLSKRVCDLELVAHDPLKNEIYAQSSTGCFIISADNLSILKIFQNQHFLVFAWNRTYFVMLDVQNEDFDYIALVDMKSHRIIWKQYDCDQSDYPLIAVENQNSQNFVIVTNSTTILFTNLDGKTLSKFDTNDVIERISFWNNGEYLVFCSLDMLYLMDVGKYMQKTQNFHQTLSMQHEKYQQYSAM